MTSLLRRHLLALMLGVTTVTFATPFLFDAPAMAKDGSDDKSGSDDSNDDSGGGSDNDSSDDDNSGSDSDDDSGGGSDNDSSDDDNSGSDSDDDSNDDNDKSGDDSNDDSPDDNSNDDNSDDDSNKRGDKSKKSGKTASKDAARPTATITLSADSLAKVKAGTHVVVDQLGRQLEIRVVMVNGQQVIRAKPHGGDARRNPGPIADIKVVPVSNVASNDDGTPDQGSGDK